MSRLFLATASVLFTTFGGLADADARFFRSEQVPNGQKLDCSLCHVASNGDGPRNAFGTHIEEMGLSGVGAENTQAVVWAEVFDLDSDGDGFTNGYELGDPEGTWVTGDNDPRLLPSYPADPESLPCGNGSIHPDEECDGDDFGDVTCQSLGFSTGQIVCNVDCTIDMTVCMNDGGDVGAGTDAGSDPGDAGSSVADAGSRVDAGATIADAGDHDVAPTGSDPRQQGHGYGPYFDNPPPPHQPRGCAGELEVDPGGATNQALLLLVLGFGALRRRFRSRSVAGDERQ